ncbi:MAG: cytochrome C oxidase subunit II [Anaerolineae bacterium]|nr:cytochrome C oxidase subunit II [Anaerolineae bacterium]
MLAPPKIWWRKLGKLERNWVAIAFVWCVILTIMMPLWFIYGKQNVPVTTYKTTPDEFLALTNAFVAEYQVDEIAGIPVVAPPAGDVYIYGRRWQWYPVLKLKVNTEYRVHLSSLDLLHGFSIQPVNLNFMAMPNYDYVITLTPTTVGEFAIVCNEYCMTGHHTMTGKIIVEE